MDSADAGGHAPARHRRTFRPHLARDILGGEGVWALAALVLTLAAAHAWHVFARRSADFDVFLAAGHRFIAGEALYRLSDGHYAFKYAPASALLFAPFALLPRQAAVLAWEAISVGCLVCFLRFSSLQMPWRPRSSESALVLLLILPFAVHLFGLAQCDAALLFAVAHSERRARRHPIVSGALLALACSLKPPFIALVALASARRELRRVAAFAACALALLWLPALRYGTLGNWHLLASWRDLLAATTPALLCDRQNQSAASIACTFFGRPGGASFAWAMALIAGTTLIAMAGATLVAWRRSEQLGRVAALCALLYCTAFFSPLGWRTNLLAAAPAFHLLVHFAWSTSAALRRCARAATGVVLLA
ncbi:MAG TPA: glycosyltransferase family 87 protein, partial [Anaeromyxobacteraceae bacterium]|nr:glycosyltransferase family 87 protein [Anaeromyxobacteraceae bacterium]